MPSTRYTSFPRRFLPLSDQTENVFDGLGDVQLAYQLLQGEGQLHQLSLRVTRCCHLETRSETRRNATQWSVTCTSMPKNVVCCEKLKQTVFRNKNAIRLDLSAFYFKLMGKKIIRPIGSFLKVGYYFCLLSDLL